MSISVKPVASKKADAATPFAEPTVAELALRIQEASNAYYNAEPIMSDAAFDALRDQFEAIADERDPLLRAVGAMPPLSRRVSLPYFAGSLSKVKTLAALQKIVGEDDFTVMPKMDGVSCVIKYTADSVSGYLRGTGTLGSDISSALEFVEGLPSLRKVLKVLGTPDKYHCIRGELVAEKDSVTNPRNYVNGKMSTNEPVKEDIAGIIKFEPYEVVSPHLALQLPHTEQLKILRRLGFAPDYKLFKANKLNEKLLQQEIARERTYPCDGIVIRVNTETRLPTKGNPDYAVAYKVGVNEEVCSSIVRSIEWNASKTGKCKPIVHFDHVVIDGANLTKATGKNYRWLVNNGVNEGATVLVVRSGGVIPNILEVVIPSKVPIALPPNTRVGKSGVDLETVVVEGASQDHVDTDRTVRLIKVLGLARYMSTKFITSIKNNRFEDLIDDIIGPNTHELKESNVALVKGVFNTITSPSKLGAAPLNETLLHYLAISGDAGEGVGWSKLLTLNAELPAFFMGTAQVNAKAPVSGFGRILSSTVNTNQPNIIKFIKWFYERKPATF